MVAAVALAALALAGCGGGNDKGGNPATGDASKYGSLSGQPATPAPATTA